MRRWLIFLAFLPGCLRIPTDEASHAMRSVPTIESEDDSSAFAYGEFPSDTWWEMFDDPQLSCLIEKGLNCSPTIEKIASIVERAEQEAKIKKSRLFPEIGFSADLDWQYLGKNDFFRAFTPVIPGNITEYELDLNFSYEIDFWGKNRNIYRAALGRACAERAELAQAKLNLAVAIAATYFKLGIQREKLTFLEREQELVTSLFQLTKLREKNALDSAFPAIDIEERLTNLEKNILFTRSKIQIQTHLLRTLVGLGPEDDWTIHPIHLSEKFRAPLPENISCDLLARRPDLMATIWRVEAAAHLVGAAKAAFYPSVNLSGLAGLDSVFFSKLFTWGSRTASLEPALNLPIFTGGKLKANLKEKRAAFEESIAAYNELLLSAAKQVSDQILIFKTADETLRVQERQVGNYIRIRDLTVQRYEGALDSLLDVLNSQEEVLREKVVTLKNLYKRYLAAIELVRSLGGGYHVDG